MCRFRQVNHICGHRSGAKADIAKRCRFPNLCTKWQDEKAEPLVIKSKCLLCTLAANARSTYRIPDSLWADIDTRAEREEASRANTLSVLGGDKTSADKSVLRETAKKHPRDEGNDEGDVVDQHRDKKMKEDGEINHVEVKG